jgi:hypothetical protein
MKLRARHAVAATALAAVLAATAAAATLDEYRRRVSEAALVAEALAATENPPSDIGVELAVEHLRELLPRREDVELGGASYPVDNSWLERDLDLYVKGGAEERAAIGAAIVGRLEAIRLHLDALGAEGTAIDEGAARERLARVLERSEFKEAAESEITKWVRKVREALLRGLLWLQDKLFGGKSGSMLGVVIRSLIGVAGVVTAFLLARVIVQWIHERRAGPVRRKGNTVVLGETIEAGVTAAEIAAQARRLAGQGDHRGAIRKLFVALLYELDERKLVRLEPDATNREYLARVHALGRLYPVMASMTDTFERVWYGGADAGEGDFAAFDAQYAEASRAAGERSGATG